MQFRIVDDGSWRRTVGVMGDGRTYEYVVGLRALTSTDGMTADFTATPIINEVKRDGWSKRVARMRA